ncbi:MAG: 30S ribosomal protein S12 methylthiotransferase RimO [Marinifilaceae bacterium]
MSKKKINIICLGCSKNLVDSELLMKQLYAEGYEVEADAEKSNAEIVVINTCGFIGDAKEESVNTILDYAELRKDGDIEKLYVMGCLSERYKEELPKEIPEVDKFFGKFDWNGIIDDLGKHYHTELKHDRILSTPKHYAYLKISEGCNRKCSYCAIPLITGSYNSRPMEEIVEEVEKLAAQGVKELLVIAQDLSYYGFDIYGEYKLAELTNRISKVEGIEWIKLHYAYPADFPLNIVEEMAANPKICHYLDIALQHSSDKMLKIMRRGITREKTIELINNIRSIVPDICLRTTLLVGHPGETEEDFEDLKSFVKEMKFERLGVFPFSNEEDTHTALTYKDDIPQEVKDSRAEEIMTIQENISWENNQKLVNTKVKVIIDRQEGETFVGRTPYDSPEVDLDVVITSKEEMKIGEFYTVTITDADTFDLFAINE